MTAQRFSVDPSEFATKRVLGTLKEMHNMIRLVIDGGIKPEIGAVMPMEEAKEAILAMVEGRTHGKTIFTR
jgi:D-arabinose 1-dehydrogenase-like Zn-dependent alcohol dehydrogenase